MSKTQGHRASWAALAEELMTLSGEIPVVPGEGPSPGGSRSGMGAVTCAEGVTFRVWAPFAIGVSVAGSFNAWSVDSHPLSPQGGGVWSVDVDGVQEGVEYRFVVWTDEGVLWRNDPYARAMTHSAGNSVVCAPEFDWGDAPFEMPPWDDLVIYELHVGTFNDAPGGGPGGFDSVERRLAYLRDLGVNAIELMPSAEFAHRLLLGLQPGAHLRHRGRLRRARTRSRR